MRYRRVGPGMRVLVVVAVLAALVLPSGCAKTAPWASKGLPNLVGMSLKNAVRLARDAGFTDVTEHDAAGHHRVPIVDSHWQVCDQRPAPGTRPHGVSATVDLGVVRTGNRVLLPGEACPSPTAGPSPTG